MEPRTGPLRGPTRPGLPVAGAAEEVFDVLEDVVGGGEFAVAEGSSSLVPSSSVSSSYWAFEGADVGMPTWSSPREASLTRSMKAAARSSRSPSGTG
ncbi:hypothetical protein O0235_09270 [Tepidiforma flava]|uniref:Uncharacterized protein n=1 Tax=Tepidiforma flava TaxID=3004094 RepID=A0ABY7M5T7_9CHLR|nr:hypothetical protein [Tepidiforma flava]WBL34983.1 hypothetical protein O0235_09270 [Tepidiforma flava]